MINNLPIFFCLILYSLSIKPDINIIKTDNDTTYNGKAVIIIDDMGNQYKPCLPLIKSKYPVTFSVLPNCPFSNRISQEAHQSGHEIILHAPMEAFDNESNLRAIKTGNLFLTTKMDSQLLTKQLETMIKAVPNIIGISSPVFDGTGTIMGCVILVGIFSKAKQKKNGSMVADTAVNISRILGFRGTFTYNNK